MPKKSPSQSQFWKAQEAEEKGAASRPGFRDPANKKSKGSKKKKKR